VGEIRTREVFPESKIVDGMQFMQRGRTDGNTVAYRHEVGMQTAVVGVLF